LLKLEASDSVNRLPLCLSLTQSVSRNRVALAAGAEVGYRRTTTVSVVIIIYYILISYLLLFFFLCDATDMVK